VNKHTSLSGSKARRRIAAFTGLMMKVVAVLINVRFTVRLNIAAYFEIRAWAWSRLRELRTERRKLNFEEFRNVLIFII
jgi:hypothetical protein